MTERLWLSYRQMDKLEPNIINGEQKGHIDKKGNIYTIIEIRSDSKVVIVDKELKK